jgi:uncharacterized phage infection (PIP) family protein YhgE
MPQNDAITKALSSAKSALGHANATFPSSAVSTPAKTAVAAAVPKAASIGEELNAKKANVDQYMKTLPKLHKGGPVLKTGAYQLKAGEHVLTMSEAATARKHAIMASGVKSLARPGKAKKS